MLFLRCDTGLDMGMGHFFRQLALAQHAKARGIESEIFVHRPSDGVVEQGQALGVQVSNLPRDPATHADAERVARLARCRNAEAIVVDGYHFDTDYYRHIAAEHRTIAAIDDTAHQPFPVDLLVNVNLGADQLDYKTPDYTTRLLGPSYVLMRKQFRQERNAIDAEGGPEIPTRVTRLLIAMGGSDPTDETSKILRALHLADYEHELNVIIGASNPHRRAIHHTAQRLSAEVTFHHNVSNMADLISGHHLAVTAGGGTSWELACLGVPMLQLIVADNQRSIVEGLAKRDATTSLGWRTEITADHVARSFSKLDSNVERRRIQSQNGRDLIDGLGAARVLNHLLDVDSS